MATHDPFIERLSDYLDGEGLSDADRDRITAHLRQCAECRDTLDELREVASYAATLTPVAPNADLWPGVHARIQPSLLRRVFGLGRTDSPRRFTFTLPQLVAASLALVLMSGSAVWLARFGGAQTDFEPVAASNEAPPDEVRPVSVDDLQYDKAIVDLERVLDDGRATLDPETVRVLEANLDAIDTAIEQCRRALAEDPASTYLNSHLVNARKRKLALLRWATTLTSSEG